MLDGEVYAEPLVVGRRVIVATEGDTVYALDASTGGVLWRRHLGAPVPRSALPCGDIAVTGITGTPVVDVAAGRVYTVAFLQPGRHVLFTLDLASGAVLASRPADPPGDSPLVLQQRGALALSAGRVYIPYGGLYGDCGAYHGWLVGLPAAGSGPEESFRVPTAREGGLWATGGPTVDAAGDLFVTSGNGSATGGAFDFGDAVMRLSPGLRLLDWFAPSDWSALNRGDVDLGSTAPLPVGGGLLFQVGKAGEGYLLRAGNLGHIGGQVAAGRVCAGAYGADAYAPPFIYVPCRDGLVAVRLDAAARRFHVAWRGPGFDAGPPVVAGGVVWTLDIGAGTLYGFDAATGARRFEQPVGQVMHFETPAAVGGRLFVAADRRILAFGGV